MLKRIIWAAAAVTLMGQPPAQTPAQQQRQQQVPPHPPMSIEDYKPRSTLVVPQHPVTRAKYPFIDVHNHPNTLMPADQLDKMVKDMDRINLQTMVDLSGGYGDRLEKGVKNVKGRYPGRFVVFANIDF